MEEEKSQPPDRQPEPAEGAADVPIYYHVTIFDDDEEEGDVAAKEEEDRKNRAAAIAADEEMAHRLYMEQLMAMEEWQLRDIDRPSLRASLEMPLGDFPISSSSSRAGIGAKTAAPGKFWAGTPPYHLKSKDPVSQPYASPHARARGTFESVQDEEIGAVFLGNSRIPGHLEALADKRIQEIRATVPVLSKDTAGSSSSPIVPANNDPVSMKRRALLAEADSATIFAGMEEGDNNSWYDSLVLLDDDEKPEQVEVMQSQSLNESLQISEPCNLAAQGHEFSLHDLCVVTPSDMHPDEPVPSTWPPKVPPLADHEVPKFDCGLCKDTLLVFDVFHGLPCKHRFCAPCMTTYVEGRIRAGELPIPCPDPACGGREWGGVLHPEKCKKGIDYAVFNDWGARLAERAVPTCRRAYCPNGRCGLWVETTGVAELFMPPCPECGHALVRKPPGA